MPVKTKLHLAIVLIPLMLMVLSGCQATHQWAEPTKAVWVTRMEYRTPEDISTIMENCKQGGFNTVIFQVRGNGTVFYPSKIEPWAEQFDYKSPGFDPLALALAEAHRCNLELHAWVNVMPAWNGTKPPTDPEQLYNKHPEWFWYDQNGKRQPLCSFYVSLNPCLPEVRDYITSVFHEIAANYDIDGLHMDYVRFPSEPPAIPTGSGLDYPRDAKTLALYKEATGLTPDENRDAWNRWRCEQVTALVTQIHGMMRHTRPQAALSASVGSDPRESLGFFRDELTWVDRGLLDAAFPMNYRPNVERFNQGLEAWLPLRDKVRVVPGLWFAPTLGAERGTEVVRQQIESSVQKTGNFCVFSYSSLFGRAGGPARRTRVSDNGSTTRPTRVNREQEARETRQRELLPLIRSIGPKPAGTV